MATTAVSTKTTVKTIVKAPAEKVWKLWTVPIHIMHWNNASDDWHTSFAENDLRVGGKFTCHMEAKNGSEGFDFSGKYSKVVTYRQIEYIMDDGRKVQLSFVPDEDGTSITETFELESTHTMEEQHNGWQSILDNFRRYAESPSILDNTHFEISINASADKVYRTMTDEKKFGDWTAEFSPSSHFQGSWQKGSKILFLGEGPDGKIGGMVSRIKENIPGRFISIEHQGMVKDGQEVFSGPEVEKWSGALENYTLREQNGKTLLLVDTNVDSEFFSYFSETWPKALKKLKEICEAG